MNKHKKIPDIFTADKVLRLCGLYFFVHSLFFSGSWKMRGFYTLLDQKYGRNNLQNPRKNKWVGARISGSHPRIIWVGARISGSHPKIIWVGARNSGSHPPKKFGLKYPHFSNSQKKIGNAQKNIICTAFVIPILLRKVSKWFRLYLTGF